MSIFDNEIKPDAVPLPSTEGTAGPSTGFAENFAAAFNTQTHVNAAYGLDVDLYDLEQKNLDKIYQLTGERLSPVLQSFYTSVGTRGQTDAVLHSLAGDQLTGSQQQYMAAVQQQMDRVNAIAGKNPGVMTYAQMFDQLKQQAQKYVDASGDENARATFMGKVGQFAGGFVGGLSPTDAENYPLLGLGGVGKSILAQAISQAGAGAVATAANHLLGADEDARMLGYEKTPGEVATDIALGGALPGVAHVAGAAVGAGFRAVVRRFGRDAPQLASAAIVHELEGVIGPSPYGSSRAAEGLFTREVMDVLQRDTPLHVPGLANADPIVSPGAFATRDADALFAGTSEPLSKIFADLPKSDSTPDIVNGNKAVSGFTARIEQLDQGIAELNQRTVARQADVVPNAEIDRLRARSADLDTAISQAPDERAARGLQRDKAEVDAALGHAEAVNSDLTALVAEKDRMGAVGEQLRIARAQIVADVANGIEGVNKRAVASSLSNGSFRPLADVAQTSASRSDAIEKSLAEKSPEATQPPRVRITAPVEPRMAEEAAATALRPKAGEVGSGETVELGQRSGPVDLDTPIVMGFDEEGKPTTTTIREVLAGHKDDEDLVDAMKYCMRE